MKRVFPPFFAFLLALSLACNLLGGPAPTEEAAPPTSPPPATPTQVSPPTIIPPAPSPGIPLPPTGHLYHGIYPGGVTGEESDITLNDLRSYEKAAGKSAVWVYFSHNWYEGRAFPIATAAWIRDAGSIPYIRLMLRSSAEQNVEEPLYSLQAILDGEFDADLHNWCASARDFAAPLLAEYGTEVNGEWFPWNGVWNGAGKTAGYGDPSEPDGPERFRDAYRHIIQICREEGAANITWVFHLNAGDYPEEEWNVFENYYPGDEWIDWIGISNYGASTPQDDYWEEFREGMDAVYPRVDALTANKPVFIAEFGVTKNNPLGDQAEWARAALTDITSFRWPRIIAFSWWNERWQNDDNPAHDTTMRLQDNSELAAVFQELVGNNPIVLGASASPTSVPSPIASPASIGVWRPAPGVTWQWQLEDPPIDTSFEVDMYDLDLFGTDASLVAALHAQGRKVICYISVGSWEDWRPDIDQFPPEVIGKDYVGWEGEKWLDIRQIEKLAPILRARLDLCAAKGFDGVEPDNIDGFGADTGFPLTYADQLAFNRWLAGEAHARGLSIGLKNDGEQVADLLPYFDWALTEDCFAQEWCDEVTPFIAAGKAVFATEYTDEWTLDQFLSRVCPQAERLSFSFIFKNRGLDAWRQVCP